MRGGLGQNNWRISTKGLLSIRHEIVIWTYADFTSIQSHKLSFDSDCDKIQMIWSKKIFLMLSRTMPLYLWRKDQWVNVYPSLSEDKRYCHVKKREVESTRCQ